MFEKVTKYFAGKAAGNAVEGVKETLNDKIDQYGDIIKIGLVLSVIIFGGHHITKTSERKRNRYASAYIPENLPPGSPPVIINNYYQEPYYQREERQRYHGNNYIQKPSRQTKQNYPKR